MTAVVNDVSFAVIFSRQIIALVKNGDVLLGVSTRCNSENLLRAFETALIAIVAAESAGLLVARMREHPSGREARIIGEARAEPPGIVVMNTSLWGTRIMDMLVGEHAPRIC